MVSVTGIISIPAPLVKRGWYFVANFLQFCCRWRKKRAARGGWSPGLTFRYRYMPGNTPDVRNYSSQLKQETESENNLVRFLLCIDFQHLRALRHCTLASPATAPPGAKRPQKAKKPIHRVPEELDKLEFIVIYTHLELRYEMSHTITSHHVHHFHQTRIRDGTLLDYMVQYRKPLSPQFFLYLKKFLTESNPPHKEFHLCLYIQNNANQ